MILAGLMVGAWLVDTLSLQEAKVDITPPESLPLGGYTARGNKESEPGGDPLYARVVLLRENKTKLAIVSCEMLTIPDSLCEAVSRRLPKDVILFLAATHTHCAPDSQMLNDHMTFSIPGIATFKQRWLDWYADRIASAVAKAEAAPCTSVKRLTYSECLEDLNKGRRGGAVPDKTATVVSADKAPLLFSYSAHATFYGPSRLQLSGDWPGAIASELSCPVLVGAIGDVSPREDQGSPEQKIADFKNSMMLGLFGNHGPKPLWQSGSAFRTTSVLIQLYPVRAQPQMGKFYNAPQVMAETIVGKFAPHHARITAVRLGKLAIVGVPGEPTSHLGRAIKAYGLAQGFSCVLVVSHVNGWMGYILGAADYDQGGYEATLSFYGRDEGAKVVEAADEALRLLAKN